MNRLVLAAEIFLAPIITLAQSNNYVARIFLDPLDQSSHTYSGRIILSFALCNTVGYSDVGDFNKVTTIITFEGVKSAEDARAQKQADIDKFISNFSKDPGLCSPR
jgi:hypothetical protein